MTQKEKILFSICIANYNGAAYIAECIESVLAQRNAPSFEIIVHDDASTDESVRLLEEYGVVRLLKSAENVGFCVGNNRMAELASGEFILLLNNDATLFDDALASLERTFRENPRTGVATLPQYAYDSGRILDRGMRLDPFLNPVPVMEPKETPIATVMGSCLAIRRELWREVGGFPEFFHSIGEDMYLCLCVRLRGYDVACATGSGYRHRVGASFAGGKAVSNRLITSRRRRALSERNKTFNLCLSYPGLVLALILPLHAVLLLLEGTILTALLRDRSIFSQIYLPAIVAPLIYKKTLHSLRKQVRSSAVIDTSAFFRPFCPIPWKLVLLFRHGIPRIR